MQICRNTGPHQSLCCLVWVLLVGQRVLLQHLWHALLALPAALHMCLGGGNVGVHHLGGASTQGVPCTARWAWEAQQVEERPLPGYAWRQQEVGVIHTACGLCIQLVHISSHSLLGYFLEMF